MSPTGSEAPPDEFLDTEWYQPRAAPSKPCRDAWRDGRWAGETVTLPTRLVKLLAQPARLSQIGFADREQIEGLSCSLQDRGFDQPMIVVVDKHGRMLLKDGHHRLLAADKARVARVPVRFLQSERIGSSLAASTAGMLPALLLAAEK